MPEIKKVMKAFSDSKRAVIKNMIAMADYSDEALQKAGFSPDMEVPAEPIESETKPEEKAEEPKSQNSETRDLLASIKANAEISQEDKAKVDKAMARLDEADKIVKEVTEIVDELSKKYPAGASAEEAGESAEEEAAEKASGTETTT